MKVLYLILTLFTANTAWSQVPQPPPRPIEIFADPLQGFFLVQYSVAQQVDLLLYIRMGQGR